MEKRYMERLIGKYCKIVTKEPGENRASVVTGTLEDVDYKDGFILVDSDQGLGCLRIDTIIAIKPKTRVKNALITTPKHKKSLKKDDEGMVGIGTLIVFIAMILIAAVAASVLITTSENLQQRARSVGTQTIQEVSSGICIDEVTGLTDENKTRVEYLAISVRPRAGSKEIDLEQVTVSAAILDELWVLRFNESLISPVNLDNKSIFRTPINSDNISIRENFTITGNSSNTSYGVIIVHDPDGSITNTHGLNSGDRIYIIVNVTALAPADNGLPVRNSMSGKVQPETGAPAVYEITAPAVLQTRVVDLW